MNATYASHILEEMSYDNAIDILNELTKPKVASLLTLMNKDDANEIKALLHYDEDTAGGIMTTEYLSLKAHTPVKKRYYWSKRKRQTQNNICYLCR